MSEFWKIFSVFISCGLFFGKVGMPSAVIFFKFNFIKVFIVSCSGGIAGNVFFTYLSAGIIKWWEKVKHKYIFKHNKHPKVFTKSNRFIIKVKNRFGLYGIAFLSPVLLSQPLGAFLAERFFKNKKKVIIALSIAIVFWSVTLYFLFFFFFEITKYI
jgi:hypothetical protein